MTERPSLTALPNAARRAAWDRLWSQLLAPPPQLEPPSEDNEGAVGDEPMAEEEVA